MLLFIVHLLFAVCNVFIIHLRVNQEWKTQVNQR